MEQERMLQVPPNTPINNMNNMSNMRENGDEMRDNNSNESISVYKDIPVYQSNRLSIPMNRNKEPITHIEDKATIEINNEPEQSTRATQATQPAQLAQPIQNEQSIQSSNPSTNTQ
jgi:hypothetical protein